METFTENQKRERTLVLIKPDGVKRALIGEIIHRIEMRGLKVVGMEMVWARPEQIDEHYPHDEGWIRGMGEKTLASYKDYDFDPLKEMGTNDPLKIGQECRNWLVNFMSSGPIVKIAIEGLHSIEMVRKIVGKTVPASADMGTIRGDFSVDSPTLANRNKRAVRNLIHASGNKEEAEHELSLWFANDRMFDYQRSDESTIF